MDFNLSELPSAVTIPLGAVLAALITIFGNWLLGKRTRQEALKYTAFHKRFDDKTLYAVHYSYQDSRPIVSHHCYRLDRLEGDQISGTRDECGEDHTFSRRPAKSYSVRGVIYNGIVTLNEFNSHNTEVAVTIITVPLDNCMKGLYASTANLDRTGKFVAPIIFFDALPNETQRGLIHREPMWKYYDPSNHQRTNEE